MLVWFTLVWSGLYAAICCDIYGKERRVRAALFDEEEREQVTFTSLSGGRVRTLCIAFYSKKDSGQISAFFYLFLSPLTLSVIDTKRGSWRGNRLFGCL